MGEAESWNVFRVQMQLMKIFIVVISIFSLFSLKGETGIIVPEILISNENVEVSLNEKFDFFTTTGYDQETDNLTFTTADEISFIQIMNVFGDLEFQLPVMSKNVKINKNLFGEGKFKLGFIIEGKEEMVFTDVTVK